MKINKCKAIGISDVKSISDIHVKTVKTLKSDQTPGLKILIS